MNLVGLPDGTFFVAHHCDGEGCDAVHVAQTMYSTRTLPPAVRTRLPAEVVRAIVVGAAIDALHAAHWRLEYDLPPATYEEPLVYCQDCRKPHEWPTVAQLLAHLAHGGVWRVTTPAGSHRYHTRVHNHVPEIRREGRTEWDIYVRSVPRLNVTITPEYVTPAETAAPRDAYEPTEGSI